MTVFQTIDYCDHIDEEGVQHWVATTAQVYAMEGSYRTRKRTGLVDIDGSTWRVAECGDRWVVTGPADDPAPSRTDTPNSV